MGIIFAVLQSLLLAVSNIFLKKSAKDFSPSVSFFIFSIFALLLWGSMGLILGVQFDNLFEGFFVGVVSAILGQLIYIHVIAKGELSITATILSTFSIFTIIFSVLFNHEHPASASWIYIALAILGTIIVSLPEKGTFDKKDLTRVNGIMWALIAAIAVGGSDTLTKYYIDKTSVGSFLFYVSIAQFFISFAYLKLQKESLSQFKNIFNRLHEYKFALLGSFSITVSTMCLFLAFNYALASIVSPIAASYPVLTVLLALIFLKEKLSKKNTVGLICVLIAILGISFIE